jgi:tetratricopeptide (TPR) repeat protein
MTFQPRIFTFYSYKGGVGRSMALLNMAYFLHARGRHVLIVDLDLDAPGASGFLHRSEELQPQVSIGDVVDVLAAVVREVRAAPAGTEPPLPALRLEAFLRSVDPLKYAKAVRPKAPRARLDLLAADQGRDYTPRLSALELSSLSAEQIAQASDLLRGVLFQHSFPIHQPWQEEGDLPEDTRYDYILVDSRTGLSEIGGLCVGPLSDRLIVLCGLNDQNIAGTRQFLELVGLEPKARPADVESWDDADPPAEGGLRPVTLGPKPTLLVASPVPGGEMTYKKERMKVLEDTIGLRPVKLSYHPQMALMETIFVRDHEDEYLALEYATLANRVMSMVADTEDQLMAPIHRQVFLRRRNVEETKIDLRALLHGLTRTALLSGQADFGFVSSLLQRPDLPSKDKDQIRRLQIHLAPTDEAAARFWLAWADDLDTPEARQAADLKVLQSIEDKYRKAASLQPNFHQALNNWGSALSDWAKTQQGAQADTLLAQAVEKYQSALEIKPDYHPALNNWGNALSDWAQTQQGAQADALFAKAVEKYQQALAIKPDYHQALSNWGNVLLALAKTQQGAQADALFAQAGEKYHQALGIKPDSHAVLYNLACLESLLGDVVGTVKALKQWQATDPEAKQAELDADTDFDRVRNDPEFQAFRAQLPGAKK